MGATVAAKNRKIRQDQLREWLSKQKLAEHVFDLVKKIEVLPAGETAQFDLQKYKTAAELNLKLINKYLPDVKQVEVDANINDNRPLADYSAAELLALRGKLAAADTSEREGESSSIH